MGIDVYLEWEGQKEEREKAAAEDTPHLFSTTDGHVGYLREAYHGGPYATKILAREAFDADNCRAEIPAAVLRERLTHVTEPAMGCDGGHNAAAMIMALFKLKTQHDADMAVEPPNIFSGATAPMSVEEAVRTRYKRIYNADDEHIAEVVQSFRDFVALAEKKEREHGKPCTIYASY
jgi:hypothetical protein